jgi:hypothetical protein
VDVGCLPEFVDEFQRERTGDGNADLMAYLDQRLLDIGCYD